jgi:hypothetical protein
MIALLSILPGLTIKKLFFPIAVLGIARAESEDRIGQAASISVEGVHPNQHRAVSAAFYIHRFRFHR